MTRYDFCTKYDDNGFAIVAKNGKFGVYDFFHAKEIIAPEYEKIHILDANFFVIKSPDGWGVLTKNNEVFVPPLFEVITNYADYLMVKDHKKQYMLISKKDITITSARYQKISKFDGEYAIVKKDNFFGVINRELKELITPQYDRIDYFKDNLFFVTKCGNLSIVDSNNSHNLALGYERIERLFGTSYFLVQKSGLFGLFDENLKWVLPPKYIGINYLFDDYFKVTKIGDALDGIFNAKKGFVLDAKYVHISHLGNKLFEVRNDQGMSALFNHKGEQLTDFIYDQLWFDNGNIFIAMPFETNSDELVIGLIDKTGKTLIDPIYDDIKFRGSCYVVYKDNKCGIMDSTYKLVSDIVFDKVHCITGESKIGKKIAEVEYNHMFGYFYW